MQQQNFEAHMTAIPSLILTLMRSRVGLLNVDRSNKGLHSSTLIKTKIYNSADTLNVLQYREEPISLVLFYVIIKFLLPSLKKIIFNVDSLV